MVRTDNRKAHTPIKVQPVMAHNKPSDPNDESFVDTNVGSVTTSASITREDTNKPVKEEKFKGRTSEIEPSDSKNESFVDTTNLQSQGQVPNDETIDRTAASAPGAGKLAKFLGSEAFRMQAHASLYKHKLAAIHLAAKQYWLFTIPMAVISMVVGILAFVATTDLFSEHTNSRLNCFVGSLAFLEVFMQTLSSHCAYDVRASMHASTAVDLRDLKEDLGGGGVKESVLIFHGGDDNSNEPKETLEEDLDVILKRYNQCLKGCKSTLPIKIIEAFNLLESRLRTTLSQVGDRKLKEMYGDTYGLIIFHHGYDSLAATYSCYWMWPFFFPNPVKAVDTTMEKLKKTIWDSKDYWDFEKTPLVSKNKPCFEMFV